MKQSYDYINPEHYKQGSKEVYEMMIDIWGVEAFIKHCEMCAYKYMQRLGKKPNATYEQDLSKALWYLKKAEELQKAAELRSLKAERGDDGC